MENSFTRDFDVIVVGGGHAGIEAAYAAAKMGSKTLLITLNIDTIGLMPCNPAIGGVGKGHIVYEISALVGLMPKLCTKTYLQARMLNTSKGPAVHGLRLQIDKYAYNKLSKQSFRNIAKSHLAHGHGARYSASMKSLIKLAALSRVMAQNFYRPPLFSPPAHFLNGKVHIGHVNYAAGRQGEEAVTNLSAVLNKIGIRMGRLKTGTPPRLLRSSIDFSRLNFNNRIT